MALYANKADARRIENTLHNLLATANIAGNVNQIFIDIKKLRDLLGLTHLNKSKLPEEISDLLTSSSTIKAHGEWVFTEYEASYYVFIQLAGPDDPHGMEHYATQNNVWFPKSMTNNAYQVDKTQPSLQELELQVSQLQRRIHELKCQGDPEPSEEQSIQNKLLAKALQHFPVGSEFNFNDVLSLFPEFNDVSFDDSFKAVWQQRLMDTKLFTRGRGRNEASYIRVSQATGK